MTTQQLQNLSKQDYEKNVQAQLNKLNAQIDELKAKADQAKADAQLQYQDTLSDLHSKRDAAAQKLAEIQKASESAWQDLQNGFESAWNELEQAVHQASEKFQ
jgi:uncharacterized coiled-coil DUF342 family protein